MELKSYSVVIRTSLILDKISLNILFDFAIPRPFHFFLFLTLCMILGLDHKQFTCTGLTIVRKNIKCPIVFDFQVLSKTFWTKTLTRKLSYPETFVSGNFSFRIRLSSTLTQRIRETYPETFESAL